jgi:hypothetical protein
MDNNIKCNTTIHIHSSLWVVVFFFMSFCIETKAQPCTGININSYVVAPLRLTTYSDLMGGGTAQRYLTVQINTTGTANCKEWSLTVKARDNWRCGNSSINLQQTSLRFNSTVGGPTGSEIGVSNAAIPLSRNEVTLIRNSKASINSREHVYFDIKYDLIINGGNHLLNVENGEYSTLLDFILYDMQGRVISTTSVRPVFQLLFNQANSSNVTLQNGASNISLGFSSAGDFANGVSDTKVNGLSVVAYTSHQLIVKASGNRLMAPGVSQGIPVSSIRLALSTNGAGQSSIVCNPIDLSENSKVVANNPMLNNRYQTVLYTLRYSIAGNDPNIASASSGVYSTSIVFILVPN